MKVRNIPFLFLFISTAFTSDFSLVSSIPVKADLVTTDNLGYFYTATGDLLEKYDASGSLYKTYSNKTLGKIHSIDASNPLKLVLFYKEASQIVFLDNNLSLISTTPSSLEKIGGELLPLFAAHTTTMYGYMTNRNMKSGG